MVPDRQESILQEADRLINGDRRKDYGGPLESFTKVGELWTPILEVAVSAEQVALCLTQLKIVRMLYGWSRDSIVDAAGYIGLVELIQKERASITKP